MFSILPVIKSGPAALEMLIFSNNFCTPFKVIDNFPIDGYLLPNNLGVVVVLFLVNTDCRPTIRTHVQRRATKMIPELKHLSYPERLKKLKLPTMAYRRARGDMIEVFKIVAQIYDNKTTDNFLSFRENMNMSLRGHEFTLEHKRLSCPARIHFFANRIVNNWNSLPNHVVNAGSLNIFKNSLDRLWAKQDLLYNYRGVIDKKLYDI